MIPIFLGITVALIAAALGIMFYYRKKYSKKPLTSASIPPIPSPQEASQHFTPVPAPVAVAIKSPINKKVLIAVAVVFNIILIGAVIYIGQSVTKAKPVAVNQPKLSPIQIPPTPTPLSESSSIGIPVATSTPVVTAEPTATDSSNLDQATPSATLSPMVSITPSAKPTTVITAVITPTPTTVIAASNPTPTPIIVAVVTSPNPTVQPTSTLDSVTALPETGSVISYLIFIVPALLVAIAFVL